MPSRATRGSQLTLQITGKNFDPGARVSFSNAGIRVLETRSSKSKRLTVTIQVSADAPLGTTGLFVVNADDSETEVPFEVVEGAAEETGGTASKSSGSAGGESKAPSVPSSAKSAGAVSQNFEVYNLGEVAKILQEQLKTKGTLVVAGRSITYEESGHKVFSATPSDIKEIGPNSILGFNTGTFHIILNSGKTYNFIAATLRPADGQAIVEALRRALL